MNRTLPQQQQQEGQQQNQHQLQQRQLLRRMAAASAASERNCTQHHRGGRYLSRKGDKPVVESRRLVQSCFENFRSQAVAGATGITSHSTLLAQLVASVGAWLGASQQIHWDFTARLVRFQRELLRDRRVLRSQFTTCYCRCHYPCSGVPNCLDPCTPLLPPVPRQSTKLRFTGADTNEEAARKPTGQRQRSRHRPLVRPQGVPRRLPSLDERYSVPTAARLHTGTQKWPFNYSSLGPAPRSRNVRQRGRRRVWVSDESNNSSPATPSGFWDEALFIWDWQRHQQTWDNRLALAHNTSAEERSSDTEANRPPPGLLFGSTAGVVPLMCQLEVSVMETLLRQHLPKPHHPPRIEGQNDESVDQDGSGVVEEPQQRTYSAYVSGSFPGEIQIHNNALERFPFGLYLKVAVVLFFLNFSTGWVFLLGFVGFVHLSGGLDPILYLFQDLHYRLNRGTPVANPAPRPTLNQTLTELRARRTMQLRAARAFNEAQRALELLQQQSEVLRSASAAASVADQTADRVDSTVTSSHLVGLSHYGSSTSEVRPASSPEISHLTSNVAPPEAYGSGEQSGEAKAVDLTSSLTEAASPRIQVTWEAEAAAAPPPGPSLFPERTSNAIRIEREQALPDLLSSSSSSSSSSSASASPSTALIFGIQPSQPRGRSHAATNGLATRRQKEPPQVSRLVLNLQPSDPPQQQRQSLWLSLGTRFMRWVYQLFVVFVFSINPHWRPVTSLIWDTNGGFESDQTSVVTATLAGATGQIVVLATTAPAGPVAAAQSPPTEHPAAPVTEPVAATQSPPTEQPAAPLTEPVAATQSPPTEQPAAPLTEPVAAEHLPPTEQPAAPLTEPVAAAQSPPTEQPVAPSASLLSLSAPLEGVSALGAETHEASATVERSFVETDDVAPGDATGSSSQFLVGAPAMDIRATGDSVEQ